jgi:outer membrane murein-binding lipoprotein Lpp
MKIARLIFPALIAGMLMLQGCSNENKELKSDSEKIANAMCQSMGAMKNLRNADPADSSKVKILLSEYKTLEAKLTELNMKFRKKYAEKFTDRNFNRKFQSYLHAFMLDCKNLTKEERETFERSVE